MRVENQSTTAKGFQPTASVRSPHIVLPEYLARMRESAIKSLREDHSAPNYRAYADRKTCCLVVADGWKHAFGNDDGSTLLRVLQIPDDAPDDLFCALGSLNAKSQQTARLMLSLGFALRWPRHSERIRPSIEVIG